MSISDLGQLLGYSSIDLRFVVRIFLAGVLGAIIGWQRERKGSPAGYRTHSLIAVAATAFTSIGVDLYPLEIGRIIQGILTGIGFIGSGIIWQADDDVKGLTTAAGIWSVTAVGIMIGTGEHFLGFSLFALVLLILLLPKMHAKSSNHNQTGDDTH